MESRGFEGEILLIGESGRESGEGASGLLFNIP